MITQKQKHIKKQYFQEEKNSRRLIYIIQSLKIYKRINDKYNNRKNRKRKGQAVIEALVLLPLVCACFLLCFLFFHVHAQYLWMDHQLYQSLICLAKGKTKPGCKDQMEKKIKSFLWTGKLKNIQFYKGENEWRGLFNWETVFWRIQFRKKITLKGGGFP